MKSFLAGIGFILTALGGGALDNPDGTLFTMLAYCIPGSLCMLVAVKLEEDSKKKRKVYIKRRVNQ